MTELEKGFRLGQLERLLRQTKAAMELLSSDRPWMPLQDHIHPACIRIGDFTIVDRAQTPEVLIVPKAT